MTADARRPDADAEVFAASITPHRSLSRRGYLAVMFGFGLLTLVVSVPFFLLGAWPVLGFLGLDVLALWIAFRLSFAQARACEQIALSYVELLVRRVSSRGAMSEWRFNPAWVRIESETDDDFGMTRLSIAERRRSLDLAASLSPRERADFATHFGRALATARAGPRDPSDSANEGLSAHVSQ